MLDGNNCRGKARKEREEVCKDWGWSRNTSALEEGDI